MRDVIIFDLDGTLSLTGHRQHYLEQSPPDWDGFFEACHLDEPNQHIVHLFQDLRYARRGAEFWVFSGRSSAVRVKTEAWLTDFGIGYDHLIMRPEGDFTPDHELKRSWIDQHGLREHIAMVFDDRQKVVDMWREEGFTCLQVAPGGF